MVPVRRENVTRHMLPFPFFIVLIYLYNKADIRDIDSSVLTVSINNFLRHYPHYDTDSKYKLHIFLRIML